MARKRHDEWEDDSKVYTAEQTEAILEHIGVEFDSETQRDFLCYCPFHGNTHSPAMTVSRTKGVFFCHSPGCGESGTLIDLLVRVGGMNEFTAGRFVSKAASIQTKSFEERYAEQKEEVETFKLFPQDALDRMYEDFWKHTPAQDYMKRRHFEEETLRHFRVGYSAKKDLIIVPMYGPNGEPIGLIGRSLTGKRFENSFKLPKSKTAWNYHNARKTGGTVIVVEASFDGMRVHQAGYPNVVALLGGSLSPYHKIQLGRTFDKIIIMTDFDEKKPVPNCRKCGQLCYGHRPGRVLGENIYNSFSNKRVMWAALGNGLVYPQGALDDYRKKDAKDPGDMTDDEIREIARNAVSNVEYQSWGVD